MAAEKNFENRLKKWLKDQGCYVLKQYGCGTTRAGVPDLIVCARGKFIAVEVKAHDGVVSQLQINHLNKITQAGGAGMILRPSDFDTFKDFIRSVMHE